MKKKSKGVEKQEKKGDSLLTSAKQGSKKRFSVDDSVVNYQTPSQPEQVKPSTVSWFSSYVAPIAKLGSQLSESRYGKILLGSAASRATTLLFSVGVLSGFWPPAIPFAVSAAAISLASVGVSTILDTMETRSLRKLAEESDLLVRNRNAVSKQQYIVQNLTPELSEILGDQLYIQNSQQQDNNYSLETAKILGVSKVISDSVPTAANFAVRTLIATSTGSILDIVHSIRTGATTATALIGGNTSAQYMVDLTKALKLHILEERSNVDPYENIEELRANLQRQEIQTLALQELVQDPSFQTGKLNKEQTQEKFKELTAKVEEYYTLSPDEQQKQFPELATKYQRHVKESDSILSDIGRAHNPFYVQPTVKPNSELTKTLASKKAKESARSIITPQVRDHLVSQEPFDTFGTVRPEDLSKQKKKAAHLDLAETHADKIKAQSQKSNPVKQSVVK